MVIKSKRTFVGRGWFQRMVRGIKKGANWVNDGLKKTKIISKIAGPLIGSVNPVAGAVAGGVLSQTGYGRRKRRTRRRRVAGRGIFSTLKSLINRAKPYARRLHNHVKSGRYISTELKNRGYNNLANFVHAKGYGKKRRTTKRPRVRRHRAGIKNVGINHRKIGLVSGSIGNATRNHMSVLKF